ncbi:right-handed parallel beta-helix repeat-containing protein [bacterium]|nr:right-handed parallel beta-helix repeat-containing protein [bacterium]
MDFFRPAQVMLLLFAGSLIPTGYITMRQSGLLSAAVARVTAHGEENSIEFYVATGGDDSNPGTKEKPFRSLEAARDAIRRLRQTGSLKGPVTVWIRGGVYYRTQTFQLIQEDSGTREAPMIYRAYGEEKVHLVGGREIKASWFEPVKDAAVLSRLEEGARDKVLEVDLKSHGITDFGELSISGPMLELFWNGRRMQLARWPNEGWSLIGKVLEIGEDSERRLVDGNKRGKAFRYSGDRPKRWTDAEEAVLHGFWWYGWMDEHVKIERINTEKKEITLVRTPGGGIRKDQWFYALNLLEEIDQPGEWYLDRKKGVLYFLPPDGFRKHVLYCSTLKEPLVALDNTSYVTVRGLTLEVTRGVGVVLGGGTHKRLAGCVIRSVGSHAIVLDGGTNNGVLGCDIHDVGSMAVRMTGGNRSTLTPAENYVLNNHIHHYAQRKKVYQPAVRMYGVGHRVAHNLIHDAPHQAIGYDGNDHLIELNEIHHVVLESADAGVLYTGRDWTFRGNVVRYNFIHHIPFRPGFGSKVVYLDDCASSTRIFGNVFFKTRESAFIGGGRDNVVENNIFVECEQPVHLDTRGLTWDHFRPDGPMYEPLKRFRIKEPPWSTRYPKLARILDEHPQAPLGNVVVKNVSYRSSWRDPDKKYVKIADNFVTDKDPGFLDAPNMNFRLRDDSVVYQKIPGFKKIPFEKIGLYRDEYRATWPVSNIQP